MWLPSLLARLVPGYRRTRPARATHRAARPLKARLAVEALEARYVPSHLPVIIENRAYVTSLYNDLLGRAPDQEGLDGFTAQLNAGANRDNVALGIINSLEFNRAFVGAQYEHFLGRKASSAEIDPWVKFVNAGGNFDQLQAHILSSEEAFQKAGGSNSAWLQLAYDKALGRSATAEELRGPLTALNAATVSRFTIALGIMQSIEADRLTAQGFYHDFLERQSDPGGFPGWWMALNAGVSQQEVMARFLTTQEYEFLASHDSAGNPL